MCGIFGGINASFSERTAALLRHRGPDQTSFVKDAVGEEFEVCLGQTRLNIVDRHDVALPVRVRDAAIAFNGEIYNHVELRAELRELGWDFRTKTDTEVALAAYLEWGVACVHRFNGMFALAIWDGRRFFCARDRLGKKPLFYRMRGRSFEFASEIKAFDGLQFVGHELFDLFEFCLDGHTLYRGIFALPPGSYLLHEPGRGTLSIHKYWDLPDVIERRVRDDEEAIERFIEILTDAVKIRMRADVPVSLFLSGGIDSPLLAKLAGVDEAFTCQFDEFVDTVHEEKYARDIADRLGIRLHMVRPTREEFFRDLTALAYHLEMPTGSFSAFPLYRLASACHEAGYRVVLSGEGCDELFAGYARNEFLLADVRDDSDPRVRHYASMLGRYDGTPLDRFCRMASRSGLAGATAMKGYLWHFWNDHRSMCDNICYVETRIFLQPLLQMADRMTMAHSVEARCPFLDHRLVEFAFSLDDRLRYRDGDGKWVVREAAKRLLPKDALLFTRRIKDGLPTPVNQWLQGRHSFDRGHWNSLLAAECIKSLGGGLS